MGAVFLAEQIAVGNRPVALKVLSRKLLDDPEFLLRFQNEAASTGRIHHANVVTIYESGQADDGTPYIAMEFLEGESLRQALARRGALPVAEVAEILQQAARGLNAAHKLGIIHRDLKPDNIFLTYPDDESVAPVSPPANVQVKIVDFGIAKLRESGAHTQTGTVLGTPAYMSFEQASGMRSDELDARSDVYSLGVVVYEMLTGRTPFHSDTPVGYLRKHMMEEPPPFRAVNPGLPVPPRIESVVMKALTKDRNHRYSSVLEFAQEFAQAAEGDSHLAAQPKPQREGALGQRRTRVTPVPKTTAPATIADAVAAKAIPETAHPPQRKWLGSRWKRIGIVVSIAWILCAGIHTLKVANDENVRLGLATTESCHDANGLAYDACLKAGDDVAAQELYGNLMIGAIVAFVPVLLGWGFIYLVLFLARRISRPHESGRAPEFRTISKPSGKMKFVVIAGAALIVIVVGVWYFLHGRPKDLNPDGSIKRGDVSWSAEAGTSKGEMRVNPNDGLKYVWIPPGIFQMGCSPGDTECGREEKPRHQVTITKGFWLGQTEVTVEAYKRFTMATGQQMPPYNNLNGGPLNAGWGDEAMPIVNVSWDDAHEYCTWAGGRLPTEAEWEYAARGGSVEARYGPIDEVAWYSNNSGVKTHEVAQKRANGFGLYDMLGNVWEFVNDWYDENYYQSSPSQDPGGPTSGAWHVQRGGSFSSIGASVSVRGRGDSGRIDFGFRCGGDVAGQKVAVSQSRTAASLQPTKPPSQPQDTKARFAGRHLLKGDALYSKADFDGAIAEYREAMRLKPNAADAHGLRGLELEQEGDFDGAIAEYREMVRLRPNDARAHFGLGVNLGLKGDWDGEITEEREAIRLKPDKADAHFNLGLALGEKGDWDGAISECRMAIRLKADYAMAHDALGAALEQKGELQPALEEYLKAYELDPRNPTIRADYEKLVRRLSPQP